jgi:hydrogenase nickel incorporation protein HypA/HybF
MHELSVSSAVVDTVLKHADGRRVTVVSLRIGHLRQVVPDSLAFYFELVSRETLCEGARLEQEVVAARLRCDGCAREWDPEDAWFRCTGCGGAGGVIAGNELEVESIEVEEAACTA